jgi:hypothetical protein
MECAQILASRNAWRKQIRLAGGAAPLEAVAFFCHPDRSGRLFLAHGVCAPAAEWRDLGLLATSTQSMKM